MPVSLTCDNATLTCDIIEITCDAISYNISNLFIEDLIVTSPDVMIIRISGTASIETNLIDYLIEDPAMPLPGEDSEATGSKRVMPGEPFVFDVLTTPGLKRVHVRAANIGNPS